MTPDNAQNLSRAQEPADVPGHLYVGTFTSPHQAPGDARPSDAEGIYVFERQVDGGLNLVQTIPTENPSFLAMAPDRKTLYSVAELGEDEERNPLGRVVAFRRDPVSGNLNHLNSQHTLGTWPCHLSVSVDGGHLLTANYGSGSYAVFPLHPDGSIGEISDFKASAGTGSDQGRQGGPHAHFIGEDENLGLVLGTDLGTDRVHVWRLDPSTGVLQPTEYPALQTASGCGPRHISVNPTAGTLYVLNELCSSIDVFYAPDINRGPIWAQTISTLPPDTDLKRPVFDQANPGLVPEGTNTASEIRLHPNGRFLYATNRGMNTVVLFGVSRTTGQIKNLGWTATLGQRPRGMNIDPEGHYLYVGNQGSDNIIVFKIDQQSGALGTPLHEVFCPTPVDFVF